MSFIEILEMLVLLSLGVLMVVALLFTAYFKGVSHISNKSSPKTRGVVSTVLLIIIALLILFLIHINK